LPELRWILLALGAAFCLGLWWWEARRGRQAADSRASLTPVDTTFTSTSTTVVRDARTEVSGARELPPWDATIAGEETDVAEQDDDDDVPWSESPASATPRSASPRDQAMFDAPEPDEVPSEPLIDIAAVRRSRLESGHPDAGFDVARSAARIEPTIGDAAAAVGSAGDKQIDEALARQGVAVAAPATGASATGVSAATAGEGRTQETTRAEPEAGRERNADGRADERIVTLRVAAPPLERFEGRRLVDALRAAGLEHGKFSIFHKLAADGTTLFSVASLVEPGTFDLDALDGRRFPGVSLFAVLRRNAESAALVEEMLGSARSLAATLHGTVQDERGVPLSPQRLADLRADVSAWTTRRAGA